MKKFFLLSIFLFVFSKDVFAAGQIQRRQQMIQQQKQLIEQQKQKVYQQQVVQQQEAYRQQMIQQQKAAYRQRAIQQQQRAVQQKVLQQKQRILQKRVVQQQQMRVQQQAIQRQRVIAQKQAIAQQRVNQRNQILQAGVWASIQQNNNSDNSEIEEVKDIVSLNQIWELMETSSEVWKLMIDVNPKVATVDRYIEWYKQRGVIIKNPPIYYVQMIDAMTKSNDSLLKVPFEEVLKRVAIIEYDFDNGRDKDLMAREILGEEMFQRNKKRFNRR